MVITRNQELGLLHVDTEPFTSHASLPRLELGDILPLNVRDEHQVINVEKLPWYTSAELMGERLRYQNGKQLTKDRPLMRTNHTPNSSLY